VHEASLDKQVIADVCCSCRYDSHSMWSGVQGHTLTWSITVKLQGVSHPHNMPSAAARQICHRQAACAVYCLCRYGTHFVSGVGHRGAFIGSITVKLADVKEAVGASASFKGSYGKVSGMAELKAEMSNTLSTSDVTVSCRCYSSNQSLLCACFCIIWPDPLTLGPTCLHQVIRHKNVEQKAEAC
jgi:hypothetical protein